MGVVSFSDARKMVGHVLNADPSGFVETVTNKKQNASAIQEAVLLSDADIVSAYLDTEGCALRAPFMAASADLQHGDEIPSFVGKPGKVDIKINSADADYVAGILAPSTEAITRWRANRNQRYGALAHDAVDSPLGARYRVEDNRIFFTGYRARIWVGQFVIDRATPACQAHESHTSLVVSGAVVKLYKEGYVSDFLFSEHSRNFMAGLAVIRSGVAVVPPLDLALKAGL